MRNEFKYPIRMRDLPALRAQLRPYLLPDRNAITDEHGVYTVRSLYYDTPGYRYYQDKIDGLMKRRKVRVRVYNDHAHDSVGFLEVKHKDRTWVSKSRAPILARNLHDFMATSDADRLIHPLDGFAHGREHAMHFMYYMVAGHLRPSALIVYEREAFIGLFDSSFRLTLDYNLRGAMRKNLDHIFHEADLVPFFRDLCVVEVKFARGMPSWIASVLEQYTVRRDTVSKYCLGIEACRALQTSPAA